jgi:hypothetical protein
MQMAEFRKFIPIVKIDAAKREVYGVVTSEAVDKDGEVCDYASTAPHYKAWSAEFEKSLGNVREMHANKAAGKVTALDFDDAAKEIRIGAKIVDDEAWKKCEEGVYTGFSHGGSYVKVWNADGQKRYTAKPSEVSLVDNPCNPEAHFEYVKQDGSVEVRKFTVYSSQFTAGPGAAGTAGCELKTEHCELGKRDVSDKERERLAEQDKAMPDGSYPIANQSDLRNAIQAFGRAKNPEAVRAHIVRRAKQLGCTNLLPADWPGSTKPDKSADGGDMEKAGAKFSAATKATLDELQDHHQAVVKLHGKMADHHDAMTKCFGKLFGKAADDGDPEEQHGDGEHDADNKAAKAANSELVKLTGERDTLQKRVTDLEAEVTKAEAALTQANAQLTKLLAEPKPPKAAARAVPVSKDADAAGAAGPVKKAEGLEMLKAIHRGEIA